MRRVRLRKSGEKEEKEKVATTGQITPSGGGFNRNPK